MKRFANAVGTLNAPPLIEVPAGAVTNVFWWHVSQPMLLKTFSPHSRRTIWGRAAAPAWRA
jgi:hypothetical protein